MDGSRRRRRLRPRRRGRSQPRRVLLELRHVGCVPREVQGAGLALGVGGAQGHVVHGGNMTVPVPKQAAHATGQHPAWVLDKVWDGGVGTFGAALAATTEREGEGGGCRVGHCRLSGGGATGPSRWRRQADACSKRARAVRRRASARRAHAPGPVLEHTGDTPEAGELPDDGLQSPAVPRQGGGG